jgi:aspartate carbamoyltransferase catalytic subunit
LKHFLHPLPQGMHIEEVLVYLHAALHPCQRPLGIRITRALLAHILDILRL